MPGMNMFPGGTTLQIPLDAPAGFTAEAGNAQVTLTWTDPKDKYATPEGETAQDPSACGTTRCWCARQAPSRLGRTMVRW